MTHLTAQTSVEAYKALNADGLDAAVLGYLRSIAPEASCIADVADAMDMERSTISGAMNRLKHRGALVYTGKQPSNKTGIKAMHFKAQLQDSLFT